MIHAPGGATAPLPSPDSGLAPIARLAAAGVRFGPVRALEAADFEIRPGECVGLVGHNGAGKSTCVNVINGGLTPTSGAVEWRGADGVASSGAGRRAARAAGVACVFQELSLCPNLTVAENLRVAREGFSSRGWRRRCAARMKASLDRIFPGHRIAPGMEVGTLTLAERQMVEIAMAFADDVNPARLVILDEPTSSLDAAIARQLLTHVRAFCAGGGAVIFISHMLHEIFEVATRIDVLKDGRVTLSGPASGFTPASLIEAMGHVVGEAASRAERRLGEEVLAAEGIRARRGEIVGLAGLAGHGQAEALARIFFSRSGTRARARDPEFAFVAGDRARDGAMPLWSILRNISLTHLPRLTRRGLVDRRAEAEFADGWKKRMSVKTPDLLDPIGSLSGGNQQKALFARALGSSAPIVLMDDPMRGVDVGAKREAWEMIRAEAEAGRTFVWYSTETEEILRCDRVFVFRAGEISAELSGDQITEAAILAASFEMQEGAA